MSPGIALDPQYLASITRSIIQGKEHVATFPGRHQYATGGVSACGLAALNCVRVVLAKERNGTRGPKLLETMAKKETLEDVLRICFGWASTAHLDVDEICKAPIFTKTLKRLWSEFNTPSFDHFRALLERLRQSSGSAAVVITRPPEIVCVLKIAISAGSEVYAIFDSHPRDKHPSGAAFIFNASLDATANYLNDLLRFDTSLVEDSSMQWQAQLLASYSGHAFVLGHHVTPEEWEDVALESSLAALQLTSEVQMLKRDKDALERERDRLEEEVQQLESRVDSLEREKRQAENIARHLERRQPPWPSSTTAQKQSPTKTSSAPKPVSSSPVSGWSQSLPSYAHAAASSSRSRSSHIDIESTKNIARFQPERNGEDQTGDDERFVFSSPYDISNKGKGKAPAIPYDFQAALRSSAAFPAGLVPQPATEAGDYESLCYAARLQRELEEEDEKLLQQEQALKAMHTSFECGVCMDEYDEDMVARIQPCGHSFCRDCMRQHATSKIGEKSYPIQCPICATQKNCQWPGSLDSAFIQQLGVTEKDFAMFIEMELAAFSIVLHCRKCQSTVFVDRVEYQESKNLSCPLPNCNYAWCKSCSQAIEFGGPQHSCDGSSELNHLMNKQGWKHCPGCRTPTEKTEGCNHMTCTVPSCNTHFCYVCGHSIVQSTNRNQIKNAISDHYRRCQLFKVPDH